MSMSRPGAQTARVGFLVFVALAILVATIMSLGGEQKFWERKVQYEVHFARTNGLQVGAPVSLTGVTIGSVAEMRFPPDPTASYIQVLVNVLGDATPRIHENSVATIRTFGLLGDRYIELSAGSPDSPPLPPGGLISSIDPVDYEAVLGAMVRNRELGESTLVDLQRTMANVQDTTRSLEDILQRLNRGEGILGRLTRNTREVDELFARVNHAAKSLDEMSDRLNRGRGTVGKLVEDEAYAARVLGNLDAAIRDLKDVAEKLDRGEGTLGKLVNDPSLYHEAKALVGGARRSWLLGVYKGVSGLWPFGGGGTEAPPDQPIGKPAAP